MRNMNVERSHHIYDDNLRNTIISGCISGAVAGLTADLLFFPLDTVKTRLQSKSGFWKSGGFKHIYKGLTPALIGSSSVAVFFATYEGIKAYIQPQVPKNYHWVVQFGASSVSEMTACLIRVPAEVLKQRKQAMLGEKITSLGIRTLFRGYSSTVLRDIPYCFTQFPIWEFLKVRYRKHVQRECTFLEAGICGGIAAAIASSVTTPLDVAKTRIMLAQTSAEKREVKLAFVLRKILREEGFKGLFKGFSARVPSFAFGSILFFGVVDIVQRECRTIFPYRDSSL